MPKRRDEGTDVGDKGTEVESAARPGAPRVDSILLEYLGKPTAPRMPAVQADLEENPEDERPTGRYSVPVRANSLVHVRDRAVLVRMDGDSAGEVLSLPRSRTLIGRSSGAHVLVVDATVSRTHAHITYDAGAYYIEDLGSQNGTEVAGKSVTRAELRDGDLIQVGQRSLLRFQLMDEAQERILKRLYDSSIRDPLTGAENRRSLDGRLVSEIAFAMRHKRPVSVILLDIDFFKQVNDRHGHPAGDEVLRTVAEAIRNQLRTEDVLARYGGEEFAILLRDTALPEAVLVAERLRQRIARTTISINGEDIGVTISGGCSSLSCCVGTTPEELVGVADRRLYRAKRSGRNRIVGVEDA
jgi:two-component system, cell cycle response regulator